MSTSIRCPECGAENSDEARFCSNCSQSLYSKEDPDISHTRTLMTPVETLRRGSVFAGRYEIIEELGKGGMGKVFRVFDRKIEEEVALKLLNPEIAADKKTIKRFSNELKYARKIIHKNVCRMFDIHEENGTTFITLEYVPGEDLKSLIRRTEKLTIGKALAIARQVAEGLAEAHRLDVIHRDLKPQNIMIDKAGNARIMDFGIARSLKAEGVTAEGIIIGTPDYMSPEQVSGREVDRHSDLYSLGVIIFEMVTGGLPFEGDTPLSVAVKHRSDPPPDPKDLNPQIPDDLNRVILRCLEKEKEKRFHTAEELLIELSTIEESLPTAERTPPRKKPFTSKEFTITLGMKKTLFPAIAIMAAALVFIILWHPWTQRPVPLSNKDKPSLAVLYFENNTGDRKLDHLRHGLADYITYDLLPSKLVHVLSPDRIFQEMKRFSLLDVEKYSTDDLKNIADHSGVRFLLYGSFAALEDDFFINASIFDAHVGRVVSSIREEGQGKESITRFMVDNITKKVKSALNISPSQIAQDVDREVEQITTPSLEAFAYFQEGVKYHFNFEYNEAIPLLKEAIALDPDFAMAYRFLATTYRYALPPKPAEAKKALLKAIELKDRASDTENWIIQATYYSHPDFLDIDNLIEVSTNLYERDPTDFFGNRGLGFANGSRGNWQKAAEHFSVTVRYFPYNAQERLNLARQYMSLGRFSQAEETIVDFRQNYATSDQALLTLLIQIFIFQSKKDLALAELDAYLAHSPAALDYVILQRGDVHMFQGDLVKAEKEYQSLVDAENPVYQVMGLQRLGSLYSLKGRFQESLILSQDALQRLLKTGGRNILAEITLRRVLAHLYAKAGEPESALSEIEKGWNAAQDSEDISAIITMAFHRGESLLAWDDLSQSENVAEELWKLADDAVDRKLIRYHHLLRALIELKKDNKQSAVESGQLALLLTPHNLEGFFSINDRAIFLDTLAFAFYQSGDLENAQKCYEEITLLTVGRREFGDIYARSFYLLGKIFDQRGWKGKAIENYQMFIELWKDCDSMLKPLVVEARKKVSELELS